MYKPITQQGRNHIISFCENLGSSMFSGTYRKPMPFTTYELPGDSQPNLLNKTWTAQPRINGRVITDNRLMANLLIEWMNKYSEQFNLDANFLGALVETESTYKLWNYVPNRNMTNSTSNDSSASGLSQFILNTFWDVVINPEGVRRYGNNFSVEEKLKITDGLEGDIFDANGVLVGGNSFNVGPRNNHIARKNRRNKLHQNIIDNPEISIKAMCVYMSYLGNLNDGVASSTIFTYNRGPGMASTKGYWDAVRKAINFRTGYEVEGIKYVEKIFKLVYSKYNYKELKMDEKINKIQILQ